MERMWTKNYQEGVPTEININEYESLIDLFKHSCAKHKDRVAYENLGHGMTYNELDIMSDSMAAFLQSLKLKSGARVCIMLPNLLQYPLAVFGVLKAGFVVVNTNPLYTSDELAHQVNDSGAEVLIVLANFADTVDKAMPKMHSLKHVVVTEVGDSLSPLKRVIVNFVVKYIKRMVPAYSINDSISFKKALQIGKNTTFKPVSLSHKDIAFLQYTGGTTGVAKGAVLTHGNLIANVLQASAMFAPLNPGPDDVIITALPLYHIFSLTANCLAFIKLGSKNILITNPRDIDKFIDEIKNAKFTALTGVSTLFNALLNHPKFSQIDFSHLKLTLSGGMALQKSVSQRWHTQTKARILEAYGLTEASPAVTMNPMYLEEYNGSIGLPIPSTDISIRDDDGRELPLGEKGELCVKGPQVMPGYWQRQDETNLVFWPDGFLRTGDIARIDEDGFVYLVDRKKDMIVVSGFNVYPNEVEQIIGLMPEVLEVGVIGVDTDGSGEKVKACVVKNDPNLTKEKIITHTRRHLTAYKVPKIVEFYDELPKTNIGKVLRRKLR